MTLSEDMEILKSIAIVRHNVARGRFYNSRRLYCPVCGDVCPANEDILNCRKIVFCRACQSEYLIQIREHLFMTEISQKKVKE